MDIDKAVSESGGFLSVDMHADSRGYLVVSFGAMGYGGKGFLFQKQLSRMGISTIYLNSVRDDWFTSGHEFLGGAKTTAQSADFLQRLIVAVIEKTAAKKVFLLGQSMGAYGALLYSRYIHLPVHTEVIAMTPQLNLSRDKWSRDSVRAGIVDIQNPLSNLTDLFRVVQESNFNSPKKYVFLYGENDLDDSCKILGYISQLRESGYSNYEIISYKNGNHFLPGAFHSDYQLDEVLLALFDGDYGRIPNKGDLHNYLSLSDVENLQSIGRSWDLSGEYVKHLEYLLSKYPNYCLALNRVGVAYLKARQRIKALNYLKLAYLNCQRDANTNVHLTNIYVRLGYFESALTHATIAYQLDKSDAHFDRIGEVLGMIKR